MSQQAADRQQIDSRFEESRGVTVPAQFRDSFARGRGGHPHRAGTARTQGRADDDDLPARDEQAGPGGEEPGGRFGLVTEIRLKFKEVVSTRSEVFQSQKPGFFEKPGFFSAGKLLSGHLHQFLLGVTVGEGEREVPLGSGGSAPAAKTGFRSCDRTYGSFVRGFAACLLHGSESHATVRHAPIHGVVPAASYGLPPSISSYVSDAITPSSSVGMTSSLTRLSGDWISPSRPTTWALRRGSRAMPNCGKPSQHWRGSASRFRRCRRSRRWR